VAAFNGTRSISARLERELAGRQLIVASNREPRVHETTPDGSTVVRRPVSGVITALDPVLRGVGGTWIATASGNADRAHVDAADHVRVHEDGGCYTLRRLWLTRAEQRGHYDGFSNAALWPLCHLAFAAPRFRRGDWTQYAEVNRRFAEAVAAEAEADDPIVFIQDYHLALLPRLVRERLPRATIVLFWHIPWPNRSRFECCPYGAAIVEAMLAADLLGFQTGKHVEHFLDSAQALSGQIALDETGTLVFDGAPVSVGAFPISVEFPPRWTQDAEPPADARRRTLRELGIDPAMRIVLSVDRLDYTKGIEERLAAIRRLLARGESGAVFVQVAPPTRTSLDVYREFGDRVRAQVAAINERFGRTGYQPVVFLDRHVEPEDVHRLYRAADVCHVNSLDDGMNLVAKEFVAARDDERGVLVLSRFAGAARALDRAILVNPYDVDGGADAIREALSMPADEQGTRMRAMRAHLRGNDVFTWAERILSAAAGAGRETPPRVVTVFPA
jgi:trehalose 6-phosphate synthase